eukprot:scpid50129/ scgid17144/ 
MTLHQWIAMEDGTSQRIVMAPADTTVENPDTDLMTITDIAARHSVSDVIATTPKFTSQWCNRNGLNIKHSYPQSLRLAMYNTMPLMDVSWLYVYRSATRVSTTAYLLFVLRLPALRVWQRSRSSG